LKGQNEFMAIGQSWLASLPNLTPIGDFEPLVSFHRRALVIGIGDGGAKIIELLSERLQDAQITAQHAQPSPVENQPEFLHVAFEKMPNCYQLKAPTRSFVLSEDITPPLNANNAPEWQWLVQNPLAGNQQSRRSARIALFNHLQMGENAWLAQLLRQKLDGIDRVFIVASALEFAGANIIGDLAVLARSLTANPLSITALIALEDCANDNLRFAPSEVPHYQTAALYELRRWSSESHRYWRLGKLTYQTQGTNLIDRALVCYGDRGIGLNRVAQFIWATLTSQNFAVWVDQELRQGIALFYSRALQWHTRLLRNIYTERLVLALIGENAPPANQLNIQGRNPNDRLQQLLSRLDQWLDSVRPAGLLPSLIGLQQYHLQGNAAGYLNNLIAVFRQARVQAQQNLNQALRQVDGADREQKLGYFLMPLLNNAWRALDAPAEAIEALRERVGWVSSNLPDYPVRMAFQGQVQGTTAFIHEVAVAAMSQYVEKVRELAERIASQYVARETRGLLANLATPVYKQFADNWADYYSRWQNSLGQHYDIAAGQPTLMIVALNEPSQGWRPLVAPRTFNSTDRAFALQAYIVHNVAINGLKITRNTVGACRLFNTQQLVDSPEVLTFLYFGTLDIDLRLQNALAEQELFKLFGECLVRDCYDDIHEKFELPERERITDWLSVLETFIRRVRSRNHRQDVEYYIGSKARLPDNALKARLPSGSPEAEQLAKAISISLNLNLQNTLEG
jgi:hypothetical protein